MAWLIKRRKGIDFLSFSLGCGKEWVTRYESKKRKDEGIESSLSTRSTYQKVLG